MILVVSRGFDWVGMVEIDWFSFKRLLVNYACFVGLHMLLEHGVGCSTNNIYYMYRTYHLWVHLFAKVIELLDRAMAWTEARDAKTILSLYFLVLKQQRDVTCKKIMKLWTVMSKLGHLSDDFFFIDNKK